MAIEVAAWNLHEGLAIAKNHRAPDLVEQILGLNKDIIVLSDAYWLDNPLHEASLNVAESAMNILEDEGYETTEVAYDDNWMWPNRYQVMLSRVAIRYAKRVRLGGRNAIEIAVKDPDTDIEVSVTGAHFYDRSEELRLAQVDDLLEKCDLTKPMALAGDLNAMPRRNWRAWILRSRLAREAAARQPHQPPRHPDEDKHGRPNQAERLTRMAAGTVLDRLKQGGLLPTEPKHRPTMPVERPIVQLDHILATKHFEATNFQVHELSSEHYHLSDHRPVSVKLET